MYVLLEGEKIVVRKDATILDLLEKAKINPETVVVKQNGKLVSELEALDNGDEITLLRVSSSG